MCWALYLSLPGSSAGKESTCNAGDLGSVPGLGRSPGGGHGNPLQYSCLENPHGQRSLAAHGVAEWDMTDDSAQHSTAEYLTYSKFSVKTVSILPWFPWQRQPSIHEEQLCKDSECWKLPSNRPCWEWQREQQAPRSRHSLSCSSSKARHPAPPPPGMPRKSIDCALITSN